MIFSIDSKHRMQPEQIAEIIRENPTYEFTKEEIPDPTIRIQYTEYDPYEETNEKIITTPFLYYIRRKGKIPSCKVLLHEPTIKDSQGNTAAMLWAMYSFCPYVPECIQHDPLIKNNNGQTCEMLWNIYRETRCPIEMQTWRVTREQIKDKANLTADNYFALKMGRSCV